MKSDALPGGDPGGIAARGLRLTFEGQESATPVFATDDPKALGPVDLLLLTPKSQALPVLAAQLAPAITRATTVVPLCNGVPWWFLAERRRPFRAAPCRELIPVRSANARGL